MKLLLRAMTKNHRTFDGAVAISSMIPSAKNSCTASPLILAKGNDPEYFRIGPKETDGQLEIRLKINEKTGITTVEEYYRDHRHHRDGAPAYVVRDAVTGIVTREYWCRDDRQHREDGPAVIARDAQRGTVIEEHWYINGQKTASRAVKRTDVRCAIQIQVRECSIPRTRPRRRSASRRCASTRWPKRPSGSSRTASKPSVPEQRKRAGIRHPTALAIAPMLGAIDQSPCDQGRESPARRHATPLHPPARRGRWSRRPIAWRPGSPRRCRASRAGRLCPCGGAEPAGKTSSSTSR